MALCHALPSSLFMSSQLKLLIPTENKRYPLQLIRGIICCSNSSSLFQPQLQGRRTWVLRLLKREKDTRKLPRRGKAHYWSIPIDDNDDDPRNYNTKTYRRMKKTQVRVMGRVGYPVWNCSLSTCLTAKLVFDTIERIVDKIRWRFMWALLFPFYL